MKTIFYIFRIMILWIVICSCIFALTGCARKTPVETAFDDVQASIVDTKESLSPECKTALILEKFEKIELKAKSAQTVCEAKIRDIQIKYERALGALAIILLAFFAKIFIKR